MVTDQSQRRQRMGVRIRDARLELGLSQEELAGLVERELADETLDQSMISRYERGKATPEPPKRRALERTLRLKPGELQRILEPEAFDAKTNHRDTDARLSSLEADMRAVKADVAAIREGVARLLKARRGSGEAR